MDLDHFWECIFSEDVTLVRSAWDGLNASERGSVKDLLIRIIQDADRIESQRLAAQFALGVISGSADALPDGALEFARALARDTALHLKTAFGQMSASLKRDGSLVTESDYESDRRLSEAIFTRYPTHTVLSEERDREYRGQEWSWVIDPIDGTTNFTWGFPVWGVLIGLLHFGQPVMGVAHFPMLDEQYYAARGQGAWLNGARIRTLESTVDAVTNQAVFQKTQIFVCCTRTLNYGRLNVPAKHRVPGCTGYDLALVAKGACIGSLDLQVHVWDVAALWPILQEAGGCVSSSPSPDVFPLQAGIDYGAAEFALLSASDELALDALKTYLSDRFIV